MKNSPTRLVLIFSFLLFAYSPLILHSQIIWSEDFETNGEGVRYFSPHLFYDPISPDDYWGRIDADVMIYADPPTSGAIAIIGQGDPSMQIGEYTNYHGNYYFAGEDLDDVGGNGLPDGQDFKEILINDIDISNQTGLVFKALFAAGPETPCGGNYFDATDNIKVYYSIDGGPWVLGLCFNADIYCQNPGNTNDEPIYLDPDCDGDGGEGTLLVNAFQEFSFALPTGNSLDLKLVVFADDNSEELAIDYLRVESAGSPPCVDPLITQVSKSEDPCQPGEPVTLTVTGQLNNATGWYWYTDGCGQTPAGTGAQITVNPLVTTTYYVRGEPGCDGPLPCQSIVVNVGSDITPPAISCPADQMVAGDVNCTAILANYTSQAVVSDECDPAPLVTQNPLAGTNIFGVIAVTLTAADASGNSASCSFNVIVEDDMAPVIVPPADANLECGESTDPPAVTCGPTVILKSGLTLTLPPSGAVSLNASLFDAGSVNGCGAGSLIFSFAPNPANTSKVFNCNHLGTNAVNIWVFDGNGNMHSATTQLTILDPFDNCNNGGGACKPVPVLFSGLKVHLQHDGSVTLNASDWNSGSQNICQSGSLTFSFSQNTNDQTMAFTCADLGTQTLDIWVTDGSFNQSRATVSLTVQDIIGFCNAPNGNCTQLAILKEGLVLNLPPGRTGIISASMLNAGSEDVCQTGGLNFAFANPSPSPAKAYTCEDVGTHVEPIRIIDGTGFFVTVEVTIQVMDREAVCEGPGFATATDNCTLNPQITWSDQTVPGVCPVVEVITRTWTATDAAGNSASANQIITVRDTTPPAVICPDDQAEVLGPDCSFTVPNYISSLTAGDDCSVSLGFIQTPVAGTILSGSSPIVITVTDDCDNTTTCEFQLTLTDEEDPVLVCPGDQEAGPNGNCGFVLEDYTDLAQASDNCDTNLDLVQSPAPGTNQNQTVTVTITATDDAGNSASCTFLVTAEGSMPPEFSFTPGDITVVCESNVPGDQGVEAFDDCDGELQVIFTQTGLPMNCPGEGTVINTWTATDSDGNTITHSQTVTVADNVAPQLSSMPADITVSCFALVPGNQGVTATDNCDGTITPVFLQSPEPACAGSGVVTNTWLAQDCAGNSVVHIQTVTIVDELAPVFDIQPQDITVSCSSDVPGEQGVTATDNCGDPVTVTFNQSSLPACPGQGTVTNTWTATDCAGNSASYSQLVTIDDNDPPTLSAYPAPTVVTCAEDVPGDPGITATDNCGGSVTVVFTQSALPPCPGSGTVTNTWTATDCAGNTETYSQIVTLSDNVPPVFVSPPADLTVTCASQVPGDPGVEATDNCGGAVSVTFQQGPAPSCPGDGVMTNTWTATDCAGNTATWIQTVTIDDNTPPVLSSQPGNLTVACAADIPGNQGISATDNCGGPVNVDFSQTGFPIPYPNPGLIINTWTATDCAGNSASWSQTVTVDDNIPPVALCRDITVTLDVNGEVEIDPSDVDNGSYDNCGTVTLAVEPSLFDCDDVGVQQVELTVSDLFENKAFCNGFVNIIASFICPAPGISYLGGPNISDPCTCIGDGKFQEEVVVGPTGPGQIWTIISTTLLNPATLQPYPPGTQLVEYPLGGGQSIYTIVGVHLDGIGYSLQVSSPSYPGLVLEIDNVCYYPDPQITGLDGPFCIYSDPVVLEGNAGGATLVSESFTIDGDPATIFDPGDLGVGTYLVQYTVDAGTATPGDPSDPGCVASTSQTVQVLQTPSSLACNDLVNIAVDDNCEALITPDMMLEGTYLCYDDYSVTVKYGINTIPNPVPGTYIGLTLTVIVKHLPSGNTCTGHAILEDNLPPSFDCATAPVQIACSEELGDVPPPVATDNCTPVDLYLTNEVLVDNDPCDDNTVVVLRTWIAVDGYGNESAPCVQVVEIIRPDDVDFPNDIIWDCNQYDLYPSILDAESLHPTVLALQSGTAPIDATGITNPAVLNNTGSGRPEGLDGPYCSYSYTYSDQVLDGCGSTFNILRTWTVLDWCTGQVITTNDAGEDNIQIISIVDQTPPVITRPPFTVSAGVPANPPQPCTSQGFLQPPTVTDDCSGWTVKIFTSVGEAVYVNGQNGAQGGFIPPPGLPLGTHTVIYQATDECNNIQELGVQVTVIDNISPVAVCDEITTVTLSSDGKAVVNASVFDDGSTDNCCLDYFHVRRIEDACGIPGNTTFGPTTTFCCEDIGPEPVQVVFRVYDCFGNYNECLVLVIVEDKLPPFVITCPAAESVTCEFYQSELAPGLANGDYSVLDDFGEPLFYDNCGLEVTQDVTVNIDNCSEGTITRHWIAEDPSGNSPAHCTQIINVEHVSNWVVEFPANMTATCEDAQLPPFGEPEIFFDECELVGISFSDQTFNSPSGACYIIIRNWVAINWCLYDDFGYNAFIELSEIQANQDFDGDGDKDSRTFKDGVNNGSGPDGYVAYTQTITVVDTEAPVFSVDDMEVCIIESDCNTNVDLPIPVVEDCSENIDIAVTSDLPNGSGTGPYQNVPPGTYTATYAVSDGCNNTSYDQITIVVEDCKLPVPICSNGLVVEMSQSGMVSITPEMIDQGSFDNCGGPLQFSFSPDVNDTIRWYDCDSLGIRVVDVWVTDASGNQDYCQTFVDVQDNMNYCQLLQYVTVAGVIEQENGNPVSNVSVDVNAGMASMQTNYNGAFGFLLPTGADYTITPVLDESPGNGVTTLDMILIQKHILTTQLLNTPYKIIAADANKSGSVTTIDLVVIQKIILFLIPNFPGNTSWRFVDMDYVFPNPQNPWQGGGFPEVISYNNLSMQQLFTDFVAVKVGDVNLSATGDLGEEALERNYAGVIEFVTDDLELREGEPFTAAFRLRPSVILGYQFTLDFPTGAVRWEGLTPGLVSEEHFGWALVDEGAVTANWLTPEPAYLDESTILFTLHGRAKQDGKLSDWLRLSSRFTPKEAYNGSGDYLDMRLVFEGAAEQEEGLVLYQNRPNPFRKSTRIAFQLPETCDVRLTVWDASGNALQTLEGTYRKGYNEIELQHLNVSGVLYYKLETPTHVAIRKMVALE